MAWVTPPSFSTGEVITAASWNQFVISNTQYLKGQAGSIAFEAGAAFAGSVAVTGVGSVSGSLLVGTLAEIKSYLRITDTSGGKYILIGNQDSGGANNPAMISGGNGALQFGGGNSWTGSGGTFTAAMQVGDGLNVYIGDTSNAFATQGLTINQTAAADEILALKSSACVAHGMTAITEDDTFGVYKKQDSAAGGLEMQGFTEGILGVQVAAYVTSGCTTKSKTSGGAMNLRALKKNGTGTTNMSADENLLTITGSSIRFIFDADGDLHADAAVTASAFDAHDDLSLVRALELQRAPATTVRDAFDAWVQHSRADLQRLKIATFNDHPGGDGSIFINYSALTRLHSGALWQMHKRTVGLEQENETLRGQLTGLVQLLEARTGSPFAALLASGRQVH